MALGRRNAGHGRHGRGRSSAQGSRGTAVGRHGVGNRRLLVAVRAVVVAHEHVGVNVAQADEVVAFLVAFVDAVLVAGDAGVDDAV